MTRAIKPNRYLTHIKHFKDAAEPLERFIPRARRLVTELDPVLWQLPPRRRTGPPRLEAFDRLLPADLSHAFEFRAALKFAQSVQDVRERFGLTFFTSSVMASAWSPG